MTCLLLSILGGLIALALAEIVAWVLVSTIPDDEQDDGW